MSLQARLQDTITPEQSGTCTTVGDELVFENVVVEEPVVDDDWSRIFAIFQKNPDNFEIVDDTVRESMWQQSRRTDDGDRDVINLYSYGARFRRKKEGALRPEEIEAARARLRAYRLPQRIPGSGLGPEVGAVLNLADIQGGKSEGGGVKATEDRLMSGLENFQAYVDKHRRLGVNLEKLMIVNNGDPYEGCAGNYDSQLFTVELNHRGQMNFVLDVWEAYSRELFPQFMEGEFVSVLCNHTEMGRFGGRKNQTSDSDSGGALLAESLQRILRGRPEFEHVEFHIPHDEMNVYVDFAGVPMGFNHGHKIPGSDAGGFEKWLNGQVRGSAEAQRVKVWVTAHRHNFQLWDLGNATGFQCPSADGGSKWLRDMTGKYSRSGVLAFLVGEHHHLGWSDVAFL